MPTYLICCSTCFLLPLNPPDDNKTVKEVRLDNIRQKGGLALLADQSYDVITDVPFSL